MWTEVETTVNQNIININSEFLGREVTITLLLPDSSGQAEPLNLLLLNDGQDIENLGLAETLQNLYDTRRLAPVAVAGIHCSDDRIQEYGTAGIPDFKKRGSKAAEYDQFIIHELLPKLKEHLDVAQFPVTAFAGFSLGGLSALDIAWRHADVFNKVGLFSASLWWRSKDLNKGYTDADRIMHRIIRETEGKPDLKFWLQTGTNDETADRNRNYIIDSIDDTIDLIKELEAKGYQRNNDISYVELVGGEHNVPTWGRAMPKFLCWAFGR